MKNHEVQPCVCPWNWTTTKNRGRWCFQPNLKNIKYSAIVNSFPTIWLNYMKWYYNSIVIPISELREIFLYSHLGWPTGGLITKIYPENKGKHKTYLKPPTIWDLYGHPRHSSQTCSGGTELKRVKKHQTNTKRRCLDLRPHRVRINMLYPILGRFPHPLGLVYLPRYIYIYIFMFCR